MLEIKKATLRNYLALAIAGLGVAYIGCGSTGSGSSDVGLGAHPVSDGGFGAKLTIELAGGGNEIPTAGKKDFLVIATDPNGLPIARERVFCESEKGLAIIEPSSGGVAFEHTNADGKMSGVLGGVTPGSFMLECRLPEGFNLIARKSFLVVGDVPAGFTGFQGAAGGNLGGGVIVENPNAQIGDVTITSVEFSVLGETDPISPGVIDLTQNTNCDSDASTNDPEPYGYDKIVVHIKNPLSQAVTIDNLTIQLNTDQEPETTIHLGVTVPANTSDQEVIAEFSDFPNSNSTKYLAGLPGSSVSIFKVGTYSVDVSFDGETANGEGIDSSVSTSVTFGNVDRCE